jgi:hypothetical protein
VEVALAKELIGSAGVQAEEENTDRWGPPDPGVIPYPGRGPPLVVQLKSELAHFRVCPRLDEAVLLLPPIADDDLPAGRKPVEEGTEPRVGGRPLLGVEERPDVALGGGVSIVLQIEKQDARQHAALWAEGGAWERA